MGGALDDISVLDCTDGIAGRLRKAAMPSAGVNPHAPRPVAGGRRPLGGLGKVNPPLRSPTDRTALWDAFRKGRIDIVASDHAPHTLDEKQVPFDEAPSVFQ